MSMSCGLDASLLNSASKVERKGLRDMGLLLPVLRAGEGKAGEPALLRKGLLEERLRERPGEERRSADKSRISANFVFVTGSVDETGDKGALPGIDGSAIMMGGRNS